MVRTPGKLSCGEFPVRTGRQTPVDGAGRPAVGAERSEAEGFRIIRTPSCNVEITRGVGVHAVLKD